MHIISYVDCSLSIIPVGDHTVDTSSHPIDTGTHRWLNQSWCIIAPRKTHEDAAWKYVTGDVLLLLFRCKCVQVEAWEGGAQRKKEIQEEKEGKMNERKKQTTNEWMNDRKKERKKDSACLTSFCSVANNPNADGFIILYKIVRQ